MGIPTRSFLADEVQEKFLCGLCEDVLEDPVILDSCEHAICAPCLNKKTDLSERCPIDGCGLPILAQSKPPRIYMSLLNKLELDCPFDEDGCEWRGQLGELAAHRQECEWNPANNPKDCDEGCGAKLTREGEDDHSCVEYLKEQLDKTRKKLDKSRKRVRELDPDAALSSEEGEGDNMPAGSQPQQRSSSSSNGNAAWGPQRVKRQTARMSPTGKPPRKQLARGSGCC